MPIFNCLFYGYLNQPRFLNFQYSFVEELFLNSRCFIVFICWELWGFFANFQFIFGRIVELNQAFAQFFPFIKAENLNFLKILSSFHSADRCMPVYLWVGLRAKSHNYWLAPRYFEWTPDLGSRQAWYFQVTRRLVGDWWPRTWAGCFIPRPLRAAAAWFNSH